MNGFDIAAILIAIAAVAGYLNHRLLHLPATSGALAVALLSSIVLVAADAAIPAWGLHARAARFLGEIDFNATLMHGMLCFLLFAAALHVDLAGLLEHKWTIGSLATVGVLLSTLIVGVLTWGLFQLLNLGVSLEICLVFGALISPTDPIAVMGLLKELKAPPTLEAQIAGESLFNDGFAVVLFFALAAVAGLSAETTSAVAVNAPGLISFFLREVIGGAALGLGLGYVSYRALKSINERSLELLITLALVMFMYTLSFRIHVSGPIAVVIAGLFIGNPGRTFAMTAATRDHVDAFWSMVDEILNAVLFLLLGLQVFAIMAGPKAFVASVLVVPATLIARLVSVSVPLAVMPSQGRVVPGIVPILTWSGLRGGLSVAMMLSLPQFPARDVLLACTYAVVVFSILVQGLTMRRLLIRYGVGVAAAR